MPCAVSVTFARTSRRSLPRFPWARGWNMSATASGPEFATSSGNVGVDESTRLRVVFIVAGVAVVSLLVLGISRERVAIQSDLLAVGLWILVAAAGDLMPVRLWGPVSLSM